MKQEILLKIKNLLFSRPEILFSYVFGSFLSEENFRDIDVAVYLDEITIKTFNIPTFEIALSIELEEKVKPGEYYKPPVAIDLKVINPEIAPLNFRYSVSKGQLLFSKAEDKREEFLCRTWQEYFDFQYYTERYREEVMDVSI